MENNLVLQVFCFSVHPFEIIVDRPAPWPSYHPDFMSKQKQKRKALCRSCLELRLSVPDLLNLEWKPWVQGYTSYHVF